MAHHHTRGTIIFKYLPSIAVFAVPFGLFLLVDSVLSYIFPILLERSVDSNIITALVMAVSSLVGLICDFIFPQIFKERTWRFYTLTGSLLSFIFPITLFLGYEYSLIVLFLFASFIWGLYYEIYLLATQSFVVGETKKEDYAKDWGYLNISLQLARIIGPFIGSILVDWRRVDAGIVIFFFQLVAMIFLLLSFYSIPTRKIYEHKVKIKEAITFIRELKYWNELSHVVYPTLLAGLAIIFIDATVWTFGGLAGEVLFREGNLEWLFVTLYAVPMFFGSIILSRMNIHEGKKKLVNYFILLAGVSFGLFIFFQENITIIGILIVSCSIFLSFAGPLNDAVFSDLLNRMGKSRSHLFGMTRVSTSIGYVVGPVIAGFVADSSNYVIMFGVMGIIAMFMGIVLLIITPRKIRLPQSELASI